MANYRYRIDAGNYGGELVVGTAPEGFVRHWMPLVDEDGDSELIETVVDNEWADDEPEDALVDPDAVPQLSTAWYECDDIEHINSAYADGEWRVYEVPADGSDDYDWEKEVYAGSVNHLYSRECYFDVGSDFDPEDSDNPEDYVPVMSFHSGEKGSFGVWFVDTDEPFDPEKLAFGSVESNLCELVETVFYNQEELESNYDFNDTTGKGYYASVGFMNKKWRDDPSKYTVEFLKEEGYFDE